MASEKTRKREFDALVEAAEELHCNNLLVITNDQQVGVEWRDLTINIVSINKF